MTSRIFTFFLALLLGFALAGCTRWESREAEGDLVAVDADGATIVHPEIPGVAQAGRTRFPAESPETVVDARPGARVRFTLKHGGGATILTRMTPIGPAKGPTASVEDTRPRHGGVVSTIGVLHLEVVAAPEGRVRVYLTDLWRRPVSPDGVAGEVALDLPSGRPVIELRPTGDALEGRSEPFTDESAVATLSLVRNGERLDARVLLDLTGARAGAAVVPTTACTPPSRRMPEGGAPRCTVHLGRSVTALGTSPDGARAVVAVTHGATTVWKLPEASLVMGIEPTPPEPLLHGVHEPDPRVLAIRPDGGELLMAVGEHLAYFDVATGRFRRQTPGPGGAVVAAAWLPDGKRLVVTAAGDGKTHLVDPIVGTKLRTFVADGQALAVAADPGGRFVAIATDVGSISIVELGSDAAPRVVTPSLQPVQDLTFTAGLLVTAGSDGTLRVIDPATGTERARGDLGAALVHLAIAPSGTFAAVASHDGAIHIVRLPSAERVRRVAWHRATIGVLAFAAGPTLLAGDNDGDLAVWDVAGAGE